jgi:hypothetical protein
MKLCLLLTLTTTALAFADGQSSPNYNVQTISLDGGGLRATSVSYANDGSLGGFGGVVTAGNPQEVARTGYAGQLYEVTAFTLTAPGTNLNAGASLPLSAVQFLDDGTATPANGFAQWSFTGPIIRVDASGLVTARNVVSQNTPAVVVASIEGQSASLNLMVLFTGVLPGYNQITGQLLSGGNMRLSFVGLGGTNYALDRSYNLSPPINWVPQMTNSAGVNGALIFTNLANPTTNNFWRIRSVP